MTQPAAPACQLRVASTAGDKVAAYVRGERFEIGAALTFDEKYRGVSALEALAGALAADVVNGLRLRARQRRLELGEIEGVVKLWLVNPLTFLEVLGEAGDPAIERLHLQLYLSTLEPESAIRELLDYTLTRSPLYLTLLKAAKVEVAFAIAI